MLAAFLISALILAAPTDHVAARPIAVLTKEVKEIGPTDARPIDVTAFGAEEDGHLVLRFQLSNRSTEPFTFESMAAPWTDLNCPTIIALLPDGRTASPMSCFPFYDGPPGWQDKTLNPGESLTGTLEISPFGEDLNAFASITFPKRSKIPLDTDLLLLWAYRLPTCVHDNRCGTVYTGIATIHTPKVSGARSNYRLERP